MLVDLVGFCGCCLIVPVLTGVFACVGLICC